ncbi:MAG: DUF3037 domain-containing protein [Firmicutes bacterium]|nr:DUF3037 domain-containing protein [Bacillota bacterium]
MYQIEYAALKYYNNVISDECLYIGMLFHNLTTGKRDFRYISNFKRFQSFDDEADIDFVKLYLAGIKQQVEENLFNYKTDFSISNFTKIYVNEFRFSDVTTMEVEENEDYVEALTKMYLKFDFSKEKRLSNSEEKKYIRKILSSSNVAFSSPKVFGAYDESVNFDYIIGNIAIKLFSFKEKDAKKLIPSAKQWAFSAEELKERYKIVFLYDDETNSPQLNIVMEILKKHASVYQLQDGLDYVLKAIS